MFTSLSEWFASPQGRYVLQREQQHIDAVVADVFGYNALQLGLSAHDLLRANRIAHHVYCDPGPGSTVRAEPQQLPFATASLDLVVLPHVLEFAQDPHHILREVERVLVPKGSVLIVAFNPFSLYGARWALARKGGAYPWRGHYFSMPRLRDWLTLLGFDTSPCRFDCYAPPARTVQWQERWRFFERLGQRWWPVCGGIFVLHGVKRVQGMRLITPKWRVQKAPAKALAPVVGRHRSANTSRTR